VFDYTKTEITAGAFLLLGLLALGYLSVSIGGLNLLPAKSYHVQARFSNVGGLKSDAPVKLAGVTVGKVTSIRLADYFAEADLAIEQAVVLPRDTVASISTAGLLGDAFVSLSPGADERNLAAGGRIARTEPAINVADLLGRYAFGGSSATGGTSGTGDAPATGTGTGGGSDAGAGGAGPTGSKP
jgi:phospholipid/cholesterol/gamma-HCH transport system substrate-binding protein